MNGRCVKLSEREGVLADEFGSVRFSLPARVWSSPQLDTGDIISLGGRWSNGVIASEEIRVLTPVQRRSPQASTQIAGVRALKTRAAALASVRDFFTARQFIEVETPTFAGAPSQEAHVASFETAFHAAGQTSQRLHLITSPELHMKALVGAGFERIYQTCRCFRNGEASPVHSPEFTMVEWYRAFASYDEIAVDAEELVAHVCHDTLGTTVLSYAGRRIDVEPPWCRITVHDAFERFAGICLDNCAEVDLFRAAARRTKCASIGDDDDWEDLFFKLFLELVEPRLIELGPIMITDYPAPLASLSKLKEPSGEVAERVEAYIGGLELANGFTELNDPREQRRRFMAQRDRTRAGMTATSTHALDEQFLRSMAHGMPPAAGMALGFDRLMMLVADVEHIDRVQGTPSVGGST